MGEDFMTPINIFRVLQRCEHVIVRQKRLDNRFKKNKDSICELKVFLGRLKNQILFSYCKSNVPIIQDKAADWYF